MKWVPTLFAANGIPWAMVTYVSLLMFLQIDFSADIPMHMPLNISRATLFAALLMFPWVLKSAIRPYILHVRSVREAILLIELLLSLAFMWTAHNYHLGWGWLFCALMTVSSLCVIHQLLSQSMFRRVLSGNFQRYYDIPRIFFTQTSVVITYGIFILLVGGLQVLLNHIPQAWEMGCHIMAGIFLVIAIYHLAVLPRPVKRAAATHSSPNLLLHELNILKRLSHIPHWGRAMILLTFMLLPQALLFHSRVLFLFDKPARGALECSMQEIGFAQGTVGVLAYSVGLFAGRYLFHRFFLPHPRITWAMLSFLLGISPVFYLVMTYFPPSSLLHLSAATFLAQSCFGLGLSVCQPPISQISGDRYFAFSNFFFIPIVSFCMMIPMAASGWLADALGYRQFFWLNVLCIPLSWVVSFFLCKPYIHDAEK